MKSGTSTFPRILYKAAKAIGDARTFLNDKLRSDNPQYERPKSLEVDMYGVLAELVVMHHLDLKDVDYTSAPLISKHPIKEADLIIKNKTYDVKAIRPDVSEFRVNVKAHKDKPVDFYWFVQMHKITANHYIFTYDEITQWGIKNGYTDYYYRGIE